MRKLTLLATLIALLLVSGLVMAQEEEAEEAGNPNVGTAQIRFAHLANDIPEADIYIDGELRRPYTAVEFGTVTGWITVPGGVVEVAVVPSGRNVGRAVIGPVTLELDKDSKTTITAMGAAFSVGVEAQLIQESTDEIPNSYARLTVLHAIPEGPIVDVLNDGELFLGRLGYPGTITLIGGGTNDGTTTIDVLAGTYDLAVVPNGLSGPVILDLSDTTLEAGKSYFVAAAGTVDNPQAVVAVAD